MNPGSEDDDYAHEQFDSETPLPSARDPPASPAPDAVAPASHSTAAPPAAPASLDDDDELERRKRAIKGDTNLRRPPYPERPVFTAKMSVRARLVAVQQFINAFEYNHTGANYFTKRRDRGLKHVSLTAKDIIREALPIQCVEAVFLACYLTAEMKEIERFSLSFKSNMGGRMYRHIVLAVEHQGKWVRLASAGATPSCTRSSSSARSRRSCSTSGQLRGLLPRPRQGVRGTAVRPRRLLERARQVARAARSAAGNHSGAGRGGSRSIDGTWAREYHARTGEREAARKTGLQASSTRVICVRARPANPPWRRWRSGRSARRRKSVVKARMATRPKRASRADRAEAGSSTMMTQIGIRARMMSTRLRRSRATACPSNPRTAGRHARCLGCVIT